MGVFNQKCHIMSENAQIGELQDNGDILWSDADFEYAWALFTTGVLEDRGQRTINGIHYKMFFLPPPAHNYHVE